MPSVSAQTTVPIQPDLAFAVSQTTGDVRLRWDPFIRRQRFLADATHPAKGVRTETVHRLGFAMVSEYVSYNPPTNVGMHMVDGSWFFARFAGGWQFREDPLNPSHTVVTWRYTFTTRPSWLSLLADPIGRWLLGGDIRRRLAGFTRGCADPVVLEAARTAI